MQFPERFKYGFTPETGKKGDLMFLQHMVASLKDDGIMATVMPHGVLFRGGQEKIIREGIVKDDLIEAIIGLPSKLFYNVSIPACVVVINKNKPEHMKNKILFINADREYGEGRNQNYLRPEDIEKIVTVFHQKKEIPKYSRLVDIKEIEDNDFNLNIRRYVDNSPDPEIEDVHAHLVSGVPKREVELYKQRFQKFSFSPDFIFKDKDEKYLEFKDVVSEKSRIKEIIENSDTVEATVSKHREKLREWWDEVKSEIEGFHGNNDLWGFRNRAMVQLKDKLLPLGTLGEFKISGIFVNWWEELRYDFKTIVSAGWSKNLIEDERIKARFFRAEMEEIEKLESKVVEVDSELNELLEEVEDWDEEEHGNKTANKVKKHLKEIVKDLRAGWVESALKEAAKWENLISRIDKKEKELKKFKNELKTVEKELERKTKQKRDSLSEEEAKELLLEKFYQLIDEQLSKYLNAEKKEIIKIFENLWDKYKVSLRELTKEREEEVKKLDVFLEKLGYEL
jgi:type I restriction enzyme M protein